MAPSRKSGSDSHVSREEVANTVVGQSLRHLLRQAGVSVTPEIVAEGAGGASRALPDIFITAGGYRIVIEAKHDNPKAAAEAAYARFSGMRQPPHIVGALSYSRLFKTKPEQAAREGEPVKFAFVGRDLDKEKSPGLYPAKWDPAWNTGTIYDVAQLLRRPRAIIAPKEDEVDRAVAVIDGALASYLYQLEGKPGAVVRIARVLQVNLADSEGEKLEELKKEALRVAGLIILGAMIFHSTLSERNDRVPPLSHFINFRSPHLAAKLLDCWGFILDEINYASIFRLAVEILETSGPVMEELMALREGVDEIFMIARDGVDLTGQVYHRILEDAKTLAAFYTSIPAATLVSGVALDMDSWGGADRWADMNFIRNFRVADPACGSGMLLTAACWQIRDNFSRADFRKRGYRANGENGDAANLHRVLLEEVAWGYDILETAAHLTAANLGMMAPDVLFQKTHINRVILGRTEEQGIALGSLELLDRDVPMFSRGESRQTETGERDPLPDDGVDLCIMNPPFVRGTAGNESFNFLPAAEREAVQARMREMGKKFGFASDKGQGPGFVALACKRVKPGGRVAMILPSTLAAGMGRAWAQSRKKLERDFDLETLIVSRDPERPYFSMNSNFQECVCVARKRRSGEKPAGKALFVSLHRNPSTGAKGLAAARAILKAQKNGRDLGDLSEGFGQFARLSWHGKSAWRGVSFANLHLAFVAEGFSAGGSLSPYVEGSVAALKPLGELADFGGHTMDLRIHHPKFTFLRISPTRTNYAGYYPGHHKGRTGVGHKDTAEIQESPHCWLLPLPGHEQKAKNYFAKAGRIVLNQSFRFNTSRRLASLISRPVQASHYWPVKLRKETEPRLKALVVWLNSTPTVLLVAHMSQSTHGAKVGFSQGAAKELPVPDLDALKPAQLRKLAGAFDSVVAATNRGEGLLPLPRMVDDPTRKMLDDAVSDALGLGDLRPLRAALAAEPIIVSRLAESD